MQRSLPLAQTEIKGSAFSSVGPLLEVGVGKLKSINIFTEYWIVEYPFFEQSSAAWKRNLLSVSIIWQTC